MGFLMWRCSTSPEHWFSVCSQNACVLDLTLYGCFFFIGGSFRLLSLHFPSTAFPNWQFWLAPRQSYITMYISSTNICNIFAVRVRLCSRCCLSSQGGKEERVEYKQSLAGGEGGTICIAGERAFRAGEKQVQRPWGWDVPDVLEEQQGGCCGRSRVEWGGKSEWEGKWTGALGGSSGA